MEILIEALLHIALWIVQILFEAIISILFEGTVNAALRQWDRLHRRNPLRPLFAFIGYTILGIGAGALSLLVFPHGFIEEEALRWVNLVLTPLLAGLLMGRLGGLRRKRNQDAIRLESFGYGFLFAFAMGVIRFMGTT